MATVKLTNVKKVYQGGVVAVDNFNLDIKDKEFIVFVGPSGCGKSTTLRMVAGLEDISGGTIEIDGEVVNDLQPKDRNIAMVFQNYALYPHLTVFENMAFALRLKRPKLSNDEIYDRVTKAAEVLGITELLMRKPRALSGGQRQRVAIGRAMVRDSKVFLMDEPLSNLDAKLRVQTRKEIIKIHESVGATTIYVTHDQTEAMTMADKIVIMKDGYIKQIGSPKEVYNDPQNIFVAGFIGSPSMNFFKGKIVEDKFIFEGVEGISVKLKGKVDEYNDKEVILGVRPESIFIKGDVTGKKLTEYSIKTKCSLVEMLGNEELIYGEVSGQNICAKIPSDISVEEGATYEFAFDIDKMYLFDPNSEERIK